VKTLVIYDIPDDKIRNKIGVACKDYGLARIQYSAFIGEINHNRRDELYQRLRRTLGGNEGNIQLYPLCDKDIRLKREIINTNRGDR
jgi:CRISPR-associated protein Cas2